MQLLQIFTLNLILLVNVAFGLTLAATIFLLSGTKRVAAVGWICAVFNIAVFAAPLSIMVYARTWRSGLFSSIC